MTQESAEEFFCGYAKTFERFDEQAIADYLNIPCTIIGRDRSVAFTDRESIVEHFAKVNQMHRDIGLSRIELCQCRILSTFAGSVAEARTKWAFRKADGGLIYSFRMIYFLCRYDGAWRIAAALNIDEAHGR